MKNLTLDHINKIERQFSTPAYVYCVDAIKNKYLMLKTGLDKNCDVFYSMKANPLLAISQYLAMLGSGCEVSSRNELLTAVKAGFPPEKIIFVGPGKLYSDLMLCVKQKIKAVVCESIEEINTLNAIAKKYGAKIGVMVRLNPEFKILDAPIKMAGVPSQFGVGVSEFELHIEKLLSLHNVKLLGVHVYNGSRVLNHGSIVENIKQILILSSALAKKYQLEWECVDVGGGFGVPYFEDEENLAIHSLTSELNILFKKYQNAHANTRIILELGRYLIAESGVLLSKVISTKSNHKKQFAIIDAGMNCLFSATGLGSFVQRNYFYRHFTNHSDSQKDRKAQYHIAGPLCTPGDILLRDVSLSHVKIGDFIVFYHVGAYGFSASPNHFLSHDTPIELICFQGEFYLAREREGFERLMNSQKDMLSLYKNGENIL